MNLLFLGTRPSRELERRLITHRFGIFKDVKSLGTRSPDVAVVAVKTLRGLQEVERLRTAYPAAWLTVVVARKWLKDTALHNALLACDGKNDVWIEGEWEPAFWLSLERAMDRARLLRELDASRAEARTLKSHYAELTTSSEKLVHQLEKDIGVATEIQRSLLPKVSPTIPGVSLAVKYLPAAGLGGDYYDLFELGDKRHYGLLLADSKTHGMAAALLSVLLKTRLEELKDRFPDTHSFVAYLNQEIRSLHQKDMASLALLYGLLDRASLTFRFTCAGHLRPLIWRRGKVLAVDIPANPPLGETDHFSFRELLVKLEPGDTVLCHTDGLGGPLEAAGPALVDKLARLLEQRPIPDPLELQNELMARIARHREKKPLEDDLTLISLSIDAKALYLAG